MCSVVEEQIKGHSFVGEGRGWFWWVLFSMSLVCMHVKRKRLYDGSKSKVFIFHFGLGHFSLLKKLLYIL
jgi:hypothetical protein